MFPLSIQLSLLFTHSKSLGDQFTGLKQLQEEGEQERDKDSRETERGRDREGQRETEKEIKT